MANKHDDTEQNLQNSNHDGIDRRGFLKCMGWAGTGLVWTLAAGIPMSNVFAGTPGHGAGSKGDFSFVQISDSHIGFDKPANVDVTATLQVAIDKINAMPNEPDFIIHTGDLSHLSKPSEFDTLNQALKGAQCRSRYFMCQANTMFRSTTAGCSSTDTEKAPRATAGRASITRAFTLSVWSTF